MVNDLENIDNQIRALKRKAFEIRNSAPKPSFDFNNEIHLQVRANRLKISTVKKEVAKTNKIKIKKMASIKVTRPKAESKAMIVACKYTGVEIVASESVNPKENAYELKFAKGGDLVEVGFYLATLKTEDVEKELEAIKKKKDEEKASKK